MSVSFPTLSNEPVNIRETLAYDPSIRSQYEDGTILSRATQTATKKKFVIAYDNLTAADKALLIAMQDDAMVGADTIIWTNPDDNDATAYTVRLQEPIKFTIKPSDYDLWVASFIFIED